VYGRQGVDWGTKKQKTRLSRGSLSRKKGGKFSPGTKKRRSGRVGKGPEKKRGRKGKWRGMKSSRNKGNFKKEKRV